MYNTPLAGKGSSDFIEELAFGLNLTLYEGSDCPFDGLARLNSSTAKTKIARPAQAIKALEPNPQEIIRAAWISHPIETLTKGKTRQSCPFYHLRWNTDPSFLC